MTAEETKRRVVVAEPQALALDPRTVAVAQQVEQPRPEPLDTRPLSAVEKVALGSHTSQPAAGQRYPIRTASPS